MSVAGVDSAREGWIVALKNSTLVGLERAANFDDALRLTEGAAVVAVDMPIGLPEAACPGGRACDRLARRALDPGRGSCVFPVPCRPALRAGSYAEANRISRDSSPDGIGLPQQAFALFPKLRQVDEGLTPRLQDRVVEVHPEVSFTAFRNGVAAGEVAFRSLRPKAGREGLRQRIELLGRAGFSHVRTLIDRRRGLRAGADDILDACAATWTAERITRGKAQRLPPLPKVDGRGLRMEIWF